MSPVGTFINSRLLQKFTTPVIWVIVQLAILGKSTTVTIPKHSKSHTQPLLPTTGIPLQRDSLSTIQTHQAQESVPSVFLRFFLFWVCYPLHILSKLVLYCSAVSIRLVCRVRLNRIAFSPFGDRSDDGEASASVFSKSKVEASESPVSEKVYPGAVRLSNPHASDRSPFLWVG